MGNKPSGKTSIQEAFKAACRRSDRSAGKNLDKSTFLRIFPLPGLLGERLFHGFDKKNDGVISYDEFVIGLAKCCRPHDEERGVFLFRLFAISNKSYISRKDLTQVLNHFPREVIRALADSALREDAAAHQKMVHSDLVRLIVKESFNRCDINGAGKLSPEEFHGWLGIFPDVEQFVLSVFPFGQQPSRVGNLGGIWRSESQARGQLSTAKSQPAMHSQAVPTAVPPLTHSRSDQVELSSIEPTLIAPAMRGVSTPARAMHSHPLAIHAASELRSQVPATEPGSAQEGAGSFIAVSMAEDGAMLLDPADSSAGTSGPGDGPDIVSMMRKVFPRMQMITPMLQGQGHMEDMPPLNIGEHAPGAQWDTASLPDRAPDQHMVDGGSYMSLLDNGSFIAPGGWQDIAPEGTFDGDTDAGMDNSPQSPVVGPLKSGTLERRLSWTDGGGSSRALEVRTAGPQSPALTSWHGPLQGLPHHPASAGLQRLRAIVQSTSARPAGPTRALMCRYCATLVQCCGCCGTAYSSHTMAHFIHTANVPLMAASDCDQPPAFVKVGVWIITCHICLQQAAQYQIKVLTAGTPTGLGALIQSSGSPGYGAYPYPLQRANSAPDSQQIPQVRSSRYRSRSSSSPHADEAAVMGLYGSKAGNSRRPPSSPPASPATSPANSPASMHSHDVDGLHSVVNRGYDATEPDTPHGLTPSALHELDLTSTRPDPRSRRGSGGRHPHPHRPRIEASSSESDLVAEAEADAGRFALTEGKPVHGDAELQPSPPIHRRRLRSGSSGNTGSSGTEPSGSPKQTAVHADPELEALAVATASAGRRRSRTISLDSPASVGALDDASYHHSAAAQSLHPFHGHHHHPPAIGINRSRHKMRRKGRHLHLQHLSSMGAGKLSGYGRDTDSDTEDEDDISSVDEEHDPEHKFPHRSELPVTPIVDMHHWAGAGTLRPRRHSMTEISDAMRENLKHYHPILAQSTASRGSTHSTTAPDTPTGTPVDTVPAAAGGGGETTSATTATPERASAAEAGALSLWERRTAASSADGTASTTKDQPQSPAPTIRTPTRRGSTSGSVTGRRGSFSASTAPLPFCAWGTTGPGTINMRFCSTCGCPCSNSDWVQLSTFSPVADAPTTTATAGPAPPADATISPNSAHPGSPMEHTPPSHVAEAAAWYPTKYAGVAATVANQFLQQNPNGVVTMSTLKADMAASGSGPQVDTTTTGMSAAQRRLAGEGDRTFGGTLNSPMLGAVLKASGVMNSKGASTASTLNKQTTHTTTTAASPGGAADSTANAAHKQAGGALSLTTTAALSVTGPGKASATSTITTAPAGQPGISTTMVPSAPIPVAPALAALRESSSSPRPKSPHVGAGGYAMSGLGAGTARAMALSGAEVTEKQGYLFKIGKRTRAWQKRFYYLQQNFLYWYRRHDDVHTRGVLFLDDSYVEAVEGSGVGLFKGKLSVSKKATYGISIHTNEKHGKHVRTLFAADEADRDKWLQALKQAARMVRFEDEYEAMENIGEGRFSKVFAAEHRETKRRVAVKVIDKQSLSEKERELLRTEIAILKLVHHPHIIQLENVFETPETMYIVMEYLEGGELFKRIVGASRFDEYRARGLIKPLIESVEYMHSLGIVHRDIKPENILCGKDTNDIKITDFGLSKLVHPSEVMQMPCGTLSYVAPEVLSLKGYDMAADIWSVGVILYLIVEGRLPFEGDNRAEIVKKTIEANIRYRSGIWNHWSKEGRAFVRGLLRPDPKYRLTAKEALEHPWMSFDLSTSPNQQPKSSATSPAATKDSSTPNSSPGATTTTATATAAGQKGKTGSVTAAATTGTTTGTGTGTGTGGGITSSSSKPARSYANAHVMRSRLKR